MAASADPALTFNDALQLTKQSGCSFRFRLQFVFYSLCCWTTRSATIRFRERFLTRHVACSSQVMSGTESGTASHAARSPLSIMLERLNLDASTRVSRKSIGALTARFYGARELQRHPHSMQAGFVGCVSSSAAATNHMRVWL